MPNDSSPKNAMTHYCSAKPTLTAVELNHGDTLKFTRLDGSVATIELLDTGAEIMETTLETPGVELIDSGHRTTYCFWADVNIDGEILRMRREVGTQKSFYPPWRVAGLNIWLDVVDAIFDFIFETHSPCRSNPYCSHHLPSHAQARLAIQDAGVSICPEPITPWCPLPEGGLRIENCYRGEDCWLGTYDGASAHGGLDINHPAGTPLFAPIDLDDHFLYNSVANGANNNRWRGLRRWPDGSQWVLASCHMIGLTVPEHTPLKAGQQYANGAGVWIGAAEHSHFGFTVIERGVRFYLDPWILFWQMYQDQK